MTPPERTPSKITVEDLLRLKRAERPAAEFWTTFEQQLRAKQLAAIVKRDPWWKAAFAGRLPSLRRLQAPVGAAAVIALLFVTLREFRGPGAAQVGAGVAVSGDHVVVSEADAAIATSARRDFPGSALSSSAGTMLAQAEQRGSAFRPESIQVNDSVSSDPLAAATSSSGDALAANTDSASVDVTSSLVSDRSSGDLAMTSTLPAERVDSFASGARGFDSQTVAMRTPMAEPLSQISSPRDVRRARLMAALLPADNAPETASLASADRVTEKLREQQLFETVSRMGRVGDPFTLRF